MGGGCNGHLSVTELDNATCIRSLGINHLEVEL